MSNTTKVYTVLHESVCFMVGGEMQAMCGKDVSLEPERAAKMLAKGWLKEVAADSPTVIEAPKEATKEVPPTKVETPKKVDKNKAPSL